MNFEGYLLKENVIKYNLPERYFELTGKTRLILPSPLMNFDRRILDQMQRLRPDQPGNWLRATPSRRPALRAAWSTRVYRAGHRRAGCCGQYR